MTRSPGCQAFTPSPMAAISPANSVPARAGLAGALPAFSAAPRISSPRLVPAAFTATATWPGPGAATCVSRSSKTAPSGPGTANHAFIVCAMDWPPRSSRPSTRLQFQILVRRQVRVSGDRRLLGQPRADTNQQGRFDDRREHRLIVHDLLDSVQHRLATLLVHLGRLIAEEPVDLRIAAVRANTRGDHERFAAGRRVACGRGAHGHEVLEGLVLVRRVEAGALHRLQARPD